MLNRQPTKAHSLENPPEALSPQLLRINLRLIERDLRTREGSRRAVSTGAEATTATAAATTTTTSSTAEATTSATTTTSSETTATATTATTTTAAKAAAATTLLGLAAGVVQANGAGHASVTDRGTVLGLEDLLGILNGAEADITETLEVTAVTVES